MLFAAVAQTRPAGAPEIKLIRCSGAAVPAAKPVVQSSYAGDGVFSFPIVVFSLLFDAQGTRWYPRCTLVPGTMNVTLHGAAHCQRRSQNSIPTLLEPENGNLLDRQPGQKKKRKRA